VSSRTLDCVKATTQPRPAGMWAAMDRPSAAQLAGAVGAAAATAAEVSRAEAARLGPLADAAEEAGEPAADDAAA